MPSLICVPITVLDEVQALGDAGLARDLGADLVELRIDEFFSSEDDTPGVLRLVAACPLPCIVTCRSSAEGGGFDGDDADRVALYERLGTARPIAGVEHPPRYLDFEFAAYARSANLKQKINLAVDHPRQERDVHTGLILSMHDFDGRPADLLRRVMAINSEPAASVVKVAITARSVRDNLELFDLIAEAGKPMIALAMGRFGLLSRVLAPKFKAFLTFASLRASSATAPGQPTLRELLDLYRFRSIGPATRVYAVVGWPVEHSMSPMIHNAGFGAVGFDGVYLPLPVPPEYEHFKATLGELLDHPRLDFSGCSVTVPHKQHLVRFALERMNAGEAGWEIDELSRLCGAANTLVIERAPGGVPARRRVVNTDAAAAVACLAGEFEGSVRDRRIAILGAGGVARAIAAGLAESGASVVIANRTRANADALAADLGDRLPQASISSIALDRLASTRLDALINATPIGMAGGPDPDGSPIPMSDLTATSPSAVVFDTVYNPLETPLLREARSAGLRTLDGLGMFIAQAAAQFELWTGQQPPKGLFDRIAREELERASRR